MFENCSNLTEINVSEFDTKKVTDMSVMFRGCLELTTIYGEDKFDISNVSNSEEMFLNSNKLIGGNGTVYDETIIDKTYARVDTASTPGYFTKK